MTAALGAALFACAGAIAAEPTPVAATAPTVNATPAAPSTLSPVTAIARPNPMAQGAALPSNTEIWLSPNAEVNSKRIKQGEKFDMTVARDVMLGDYVVIPRGTKGIGQISYRTGKGAFGKSAKMEFNIVNIELNGQLVPVTGHYRVEGQGNTGATVGTAVAVGIFSAFVTGRSAIIAQGTEYKAYTTNPIPVALPTPPEPAAPAEPVASPVAAGSATATM
jgi:hypothetical protein